MARILIVEDEKELAVALQKGLSEFGHDVDIAFDGDEALSAIERDHFDLIFLDLVMPGTDGFDVLTRLHAEGKGVERRVVVLTNLSQPEHDQRVRRLGAKDFLVKSRYSLADIGALVETYISA